MWMPTSYLICVLLYVSCMLWPAPDLTSRPQLLLFPVLWPNHCMYIGLNACTWSDTSRESLRSISAFIEKTCWSTSWSGLLYSDWLFSNLEHRRFTTWYSVFLCGGFIAWRSCLLTTVAKSATEVEHYALSNCIDEVTFMKPAAAWIGYQNWSRPNLRRQLRCSRPGWPSCLSQASQAHLHTVSRCPREGCWWNGYCTEDSHKNQLSRREYLGCFKGGVWYTVAFYCM